MSQPATQQDPFEPPIDLNEILAAMDDLGRALFNAALGTVKAHKLQELARAQQERIAELEGQRNEAAQKNGKAATARAAENARTQAALGLHGG